MRALITNDDGIDSPGLVALARATVECGFDVQIAAPSTEASGTGTSLATIGGTSRIRFERKEVGGFEGFAVPAHPGLIAFIACHGGFGGPFDVVLSGVNYGANVSTGILHSGTVGAAMTAGVRGVSALAVSLDLGLRGAEPVWENAVAAVRQVLPMLVEMPAATVLNLNVPNGEVRGLKWAGIAPHSPLRVQVTDVGDDELKLSLADADVPPMPGSEVALLAERYATVTPLRSISRDTEAVLPELG